MKTESIAEEGAKVKTSASVNDRAIRRLREHLAEIENLPKRPQDDLLSSGEFGFMKRSWAEEAMRRALEEDDFYLLPKSKLVAALTTFENDGGNEACALVCISSRGFVTVDHYAFINSLKMGDVAIEFAAALDAKESADAK